MLHYIYKNRKILHSPHIKEKIGFLYDRFNGGAEAWEVHEICRKAFLTGAIVFLPEPILQAAFACLMSAISCCTLNYFKPQKNKLVFWIAESSFLITLLVFIFSIVLMGSDASKTEGGNFILGLCLIIFNSLFVVCSFTAIGTQTFFIIRKMKRMENKNKNKIKPIEGENNNEKRRSLQLAGKAVIDSNMPIAIQHTLQYIREAFGAGSTEYASSMKVMHDLRFDRISNKRDLQQRMHLIFKNITDQKIKNTIEKKVEECWSMAG